jgi:predicted dehydrogenase
MGTQGFNELGSLLEAPEIQIVAVCDPNRDSSDYVEWSKHSTRNRIRRYLDNPTWRSGDDGCPGGREVGRVVVDTYYSNHRGQTGGGCRSYADFRELLSREKDLDAVKIMTPDHLHAAISIAAMKQGKHVLMHKPIANRLIEGKKVLETARAAGVVTHLLAYGSGAANAKIVEQIRKGIIGPLREVHNWSNRPAWPQYTEIPRERPPVPPGFNWDLWLGPALPRPYHPCYTHTVFRGWYDFGGGSMADMGVYSLWPVCTGLDLGPPLSAQAWATHTCTIVDQVSKTKKNDFSYPTACTIRLGFAARPAVPALDIFWYDGGMKPRLPATIEAHDVPMKREGILFVGDDGCILADFRGQNAELFAKGQRTPLRMEEETSGRRAARHHPWLQACLGNEPSPGSFLNAGSITDAVNLGTVALRVGRKILFDSSSMEITNLPEANHYLTREYRGGWEL